MRGTARSAGSPIAAGFAWQRDRRDQLEVVATLGHQPRLQPARGAERGNSDLRVQSGQGIGDGHRGLHMSGGAAAGKDD